MNDDAARIKEAVVSRLMTAKRTVWAPDTESCGHEMAVGRRELHVCALHPERLFCAECWQDHANTHDAPCDGCGLPSTSSAPKMELAGASYFLPSGRVDVVPVLHCGDLACEFEGCLATVAAAEKLCSEELKTLLALERAIVNGDDTPSVN